MRLREEKDSEERAYRKLHTGMKSGERLRWKKRLEEKAEKERRKLGKRGERRR